MKKPQEQLEQLKEVISAMKLGEGDVITFKIQNVTAMTCHGSVTDVTASALLPILNLISDLAEQDIEAATSAVSLMMLQLVAGLNAVMEHNGMSIKERALETAKLLEFPLADAVVLSAAISTAEDFIYNMPKEIEGQGFYVGKERSILDEIKRRFS